ncbi:MAG: class I SAM-dependent methyltransferase [Planctomycetes bacterium]|nr:class I SAM-dependent methyltransferase [Planctomycetota bacterium]
MIDVDFGRRSEDYAKYRSGFPESFYERVKAFISLNGSRAVDLGAGPGIVAIELAKRGATVTGVDISQNQIDAARDRAAKAGVADRCSFIVAPAENTALPGGEFDLVTAGQCWGWFDEPVVLREVDRLLRPGGWLIVPQDCYLPRLDDVARTTERLILQYNPDWTMADFDGLYPQRIDALIEGGFQFVEQCCYDHHQPFTHEAWRGRIRTCNGVGSGSMSESQVEQFDAALAELLRNEFPHEPLMIRHRIWVVIVRKPNSK